MGLKKSSETSRFMIEKWVSCHSLRSLPSQVTCFRCKTNLHRQADFRWRNELAVTTSKHLPSPSTCFRCLDDSRTRLRMKVKVLRSPGSWAKVTMYPSEKTRIGSAGWEDTEKTWCIDSASSAEEGSNSLSSSRRWASSPLEVRNRQETIGVEGMTC